MNSYGRVSRWAARGRSDDLGPARPTTTAAARRRWPRPSGGRCRGPGRSTRRRCGRARRRPSGMPGPSSATVTTAPPPSRGRTSTPSAVPSGVWAKTLPSRASTAAARSAAGTRTGSGVAGSPTPDAAGPRPRPAPTRTRPARRRPRSRRTRRPRPRGRGVGPRGSPRRCPGSSASTSSRSRSRSAGGSPSTSSRSAVSGVRSRCARSAAPSRSAASSSPIRPASWLTAVPTSRTSAGPAGARGPRGRRCPAGGRSRPAR